MTFNQIFAIVFRWTFSIVFSLLIVGTLASVAIFLEWVFVIKAITEPGIFPPGFMGFHNY